MALPAEWAWIEDMIAEEGRSITLIPTGVLEDVTKPWRGVKPGTSVAVDAALVRYRDKDVDDDTIRRGDYKAYLAPPAGFDMAKISTVEDSDDNSVWRVVGFQKIQPGSDILLYILQLRR